MSAIICFCGHAKHYHYVTGVTSCVATIAQGLCACTEWRPQEGPTVGRTYYDSAKSVAVDPVNHPPHYSSHPSGIECIDVVEHMGFCIGNAIKYLWRAGKKGDLIEDLKKAKWYIDREIERLERAKK